MLESGDSERTDGQTNEETNGRTLPLRIATTCLVK